jgi:arylsulfatase A-like enzyme
MQRRVTGSYFSRFLVFPLGLLLFAVPANGDDSLRPNVVFILADDLGWSDTTLFGTTELYETPNLERLAARGMTFSQAYAASPLCSPTRASIITGQYPARVGITSPVCHVPEVRLEPSVVPKGPPTKKSLVCTSASRLKTEHITLAETFQSAGYATAHFGKWHLGREPYDPLHHGFDLDVPHWPGPGPAGSFVAPWKFPTFKERAPGEHIEDRMGDEAVAFIEQNQNKPFYLNYWQFSVHAPFDAKAEYIERHRTRIDPQNPQRSPTYASMVQSLDENVGKILDTLDRLKIADRTIIIFFSDNGGNMYDMVDETTPTSNLPLRGGKATMYEGGVRVPCVFVWPDHVEPGTRSDAIIQSVDFYPTLLDLLDMKRPPQQILDGISIRPALEGGDLLRDSIFTYFPHAPKVPEWLGPSASVRSGDWKLIRIFFDGIGQKHRYELYNLRNDLGESQNLASQHPEIVARLDKQITRYLETTNATLPAANPAFQPRVPALAEMGIHPASDCTLDPGPGQLLVTSTGGDPHFSLQLPQSAVLGPHEVVLRMKSQGKGTAQLFWETMYGRPAYHASRRLTFAVQHDGEFHDYKLPFESDGTLVSLRLDPMASPGTSAIEFMRLFDGQGKLVTEWDFRMFKAATSTDETSNSDSRAKIPSTSSAANTSVVKTPKKKISRDEKYRRLAIGTWQDDYKGKRTMTLDSDGTGRMVVELSGMTATLFASKLEFDMVWSVQDGRMKKRTVGGKPKRRVDMILKAMGDRVNERILELSEDRLLLLDEDGSTKYDWRRVE